MCGEKADAARFFTTHTENTCSFVSYDALRSCLILCKSAAALCRSWCAFFT
jgi:hypothetical protein